MDRFIVSGIPKFDGDYPIDIGSFTMRELQIIKRMSGVRAGELEEAFGAGDSDLILAIAVIAVRRNGKEWEQFERLAWEADLASITFVGECKVDGCERDAEGDNGYCAMHREGETGTAGDAVPLIPPTPLAPSESSVEQQPPSGETSESGGDDLQETSQQATGSLRSVTGAA